MRAKVFACIFAALGLTAFIAFIVADARHQLVLARLCTVLTLIMWPGKKSGEDQ